MGNAPIWKWILTQPYKKKHRYNVIIYYTIKETQTSTVCMFLPYQGTLSSIKPIEKWYLDYQAYRNATLVCATYFSRGAPGIQNAVYCCSRQKHIHRKIRSSTNISHVILFFVVTWFAI